jgi:hypothetical protein
MFLGSYFKKETLSVEFKEFCLKIPIETIFSEEKIKELYTFKIPRELYTHFERNLEYYILNYVPKYMSSFSNASIKQGRLYIGIKDDGQITGIPWNRDMPLTVDHVKTYLEKTKSLIHIDSKTETIDSYFEKIKVKIHPLHIQPMDTSMIEMHSKRVEEEETLYNTSRAFYDIQKEEWRKRLYFCARKVEAFVRDPVIQTDMEQWFNRIGKYEYASQVKTFNVDNDIIYKHKNDSEHYMYWIMQYRDLCIRNIRSQKPVFKYQKNKKMYYSLNVNKLFPFAGKWVEENSKDILYYVIEIRFPGGKRFEDINVFYKKHDKLIHRKRSILHQGVVGCM